jgi:hypothetical protein
MELTNMNFDNPNKRVFYPTVAMGANEPMGELTIYTFVRMSHKGIWYDIKVMDQYLNSITKWDGKRIQDNLSEKFSTEFVVKCLKQFHIKAYTTQKFYIVDPSIVDKQGAPIHKKSMLQITEEERLKRQYKLGI